MILTVSHRHKNAHGWYFRADWQERRTVFAMSLPILYLDVDGVLCPVDVPHHDEFGDWQTVPGSFDMPWSPTLAGLVGGLPAKRVWLTSWQHEANELLSPLFNWPELPVLEHKPGSLWWKLDSLVQHHEPGNPFVWVDDELGKQIIELGHLFQAAIDSLSVPHLLVSTTSGQGITRGDIESIAQFCHENTPRIS
jgi:hypothetical protein